MSLPDPPTTRDQLRLWLSDHLDIQLPDRPLCPNHQSPLDYLCRAFFEPAVDQVVWAPRGGGKTTLGAVATLLDLLYKPGCSIRILGGSLEQSARMWQCLQPLLERFEDQIDGKLTNARLRLTNGSVAAIVAQSQTSVRGLRVQKLRCDEVELFKPDIWEAAQLVTRSRRQAESAAGVGGVIEALSTHHKPYGVMARVLREAAESGRAVVHWCLLDILETCPPDRPCEGCLLQPDCAGAAHAERQGHFLIDDAIAMKQRVSVETWEAEMLCRRPGRRDAVFSHFSPERHVRESVALRAPVRLWLGIDFGYRNPFVCLWIRHDAAGAVHVIDEYVCSGLLVPEHVAVIARRAHGQVFRLACDPAGNHPNDQTSRSNIDVLRASGYLVRSRASRILDGVEMIRAALAPAAGEPSLFVHPRCRRLIEALREYHYRDENDENPEKDGRHDHLIDALRYFYVNAAHAAGALATLY